MFNVRRKAANNYLKKLIDLGLIARKGAGSVHFLFLTLTAPENE